MTEKEKTLVEHLEELRRRIICILISVGLTTIGAFFFSRKILNFLLFPLKDKLEKIIFIRPTEALFTTLQVSLFAGILISLPLILYHFWAFVAPGLTREEKRFFFPLLIFSVIMFLSGISFSFFIVLPLGLSFLLRFSSPQLKPLFTISHYISFLTFFLLGFGVIFESPLVISVLSRMGIISPYDLKKWRKQAIVIILIIAATLTPPDIFTQLMLAVPLYLLYEVSIILSYIFHKGVKIEEE